jgi:predicted Rossmann fold nucleotide-binding protein DprA/Smf involved in DNA uptake
MAVDDAYAKIEKEEQDAYEKRMAALKQKKEKAKEKERNLIRRGNELKGKKSNLLKKLHKANTSIDASNIDRIEEEEAVIAQTRIDLMVQHESRVEDIKKKCGYNYDEEHKRLQKLEDDIRSNDAERKVSFSCVRAFDIPC